MNNHIILDEKIISQRGRIRRIRRWLKGIHPERGVIIKGWTGWETVEERDELMPVRFYKVRDLSIAKRRLKNGRAIGQRLPLVAN